jgi:Arc/MetJ family transcription regulator
MATNLAIEDKLIEEAKKIGKHKTKKAAVTEALKEYIQRRKQMEIFDLAGQIDYDPEYDYKVQRKKS